MKRHKLKVILDVVLTAALIFEMFYMYTGNLLHELVGMMFFITLIGHIAATRKWVVGIAGKAKSRRAVPLKQKAMLVVAVLIGVIGGLLLASSLLISNALASLAGVHLSGSAYQVASFMHVLLAYALCGAAVIHVALHWVSLFNVMSIPYEASKRNAINVGISSVAAVGLIALGATAARALDMVPSSSGTRDTQGNDAQNGANSPSNSSKAGDAPEASSAPGEQRGVQNRSGSTLGPGASENSGSSSTSGICTLCHKQCPLSAPQCNKPYAAGLL